MVQKNRLNTKKFIKQVKLFADIMTVLASDFNCKIVWKKVKNKDWSAQYILKSNKILLACELIFNERELWSSFFHELAHAYCSANKIYSKYHRPHREYKLALRAERYVDSLAAGWMSIYFPELEYSYSY